MTLSSDYLRMCGETEAHPSFSVVTTSEAFASLFSLYILKDYLPAGRRRRKKPLGISVPPCSIVLCLKFMDNVD
jgi:hypothetical protein